MIKYTNSKICIKNINIYLTQKYGALTVVNYFVAHILD